MLKTLIAALFAFLTGTVITTLLKDKKILELHKRNLHLESEDHFYSIFKEGWDAGNEWGRRRGYNAHALGLPMHEYN